MKKINFILSLVFILISGSLYGQSKEQLANGYNFIKTQIYSSNQNSRLFKLYKGLRVSDVSDGMDYVGLHNKGLVDPAIHAGWTGRTAAKAHAFQGIAVTCRYVPSQRPNWPASSVGDMQAEPPSGEASNRSMDRFSKWVGHMYSTHSPEKFKPVLFKGAVLVRDDVGNENSGIGSNNIMNWVRQGMVGVVTNGNVRDIDEIRLEKVPIYFRSHGRGIRPARSELESVNRPVNIGGVQVRPGDVVVADGDGVIVVPRRVAVPVAEYAHNVLKGDKAGRKKLYKELGIPLDQTVESNNH